MREAQRNGYRERAWDTRAGRIGLEIPKLRKGSSSGWRLENSRTNASVARLTRTTSSQRCLA